jgi:hypothetical protein
MSTSLPEGVYPGCSAISGIAQPGGGMWVNVPGIGSSVRAIASNRIDSQTNLTVTVDRAGAVRVFGVGERPPTLERTTEFRRSRRRTSTERLVRAAYILIEDRITIEPFTRRRYYRLVLPQIAPIDIPFVASRIEIDPPVSTVTGGLINFYVPTVIPLISINRGSPSTIHIDFLHTALDEPPIDQLVNQQPLPLYYKHWQYIAELVEVEQSGSWRSFAFEGVTEYPFNFTYDSEEEQWSKASALYGLQLSLDTELNTFFLVNQSELFPDTSTYTSRNYYGMLYLNTSFPDPTQETTMRIRGYKFIDRAAILLTDDNTYETTANILLSGQEVLQVFEPLSDWGLAIEYENVLGTLTPLNSFIDPSIAVLILDE